MSRYIVPDASALASAFYNEASSENATPLLEAIRSQSVDSVAPSLALPEFLNVSRKKQIGNVGSGYAPIPAALVDGIVGDFLTLPIIWEEIEALSARAWRLHRDHGIQTADAFFLETARIWRAELWTADDQFFKRAALVYVDVFSLRMQPFA